ncbi:MAG: hypothetical protein ABI651_14135 [Verrucomicrobiota bacterium]
MAKAFAISIAFHLALFGSLEMNQRFRWLNKNPLITWLKEALLQPLVTLPKETTKSAPDTRPEVPLLFVDVDPAQAVLEPPQETKYYSSLSSRAANPDPKTDANVPRIDGQQIKIPKSFDTLRPQPIPVPPAQPPQEKQSESKADETTLKRKGGQPEGDLSLAKPQLNSGPSQDNPGHSELRASPPPRPRTLAAARQQNGIVVAPKMKQEGSVKRSGSVSLDVKGTAFGAYDAAIIAAVQQRWYDLLDERKYASDGTGKAVLEFRLNHDGKISNMKTAESDVSDLLTLLCQRAVMDPSPYARWPDDMRRLVGGNFREVRFTFYY